MLGLSIAFFAIAVLMVAVGIFEGWGFYDSERIRIIALVALSGFFLGLYRIIDLLEKKQ